MPSGHRWLTLALGLALLPASPASGGDCPPPAFLVEHHALMQAGRYAEAEKEARRLVADLSARHGADSVPVAQALEGLAMAVVRAGRLEAPEALEAARRAVEIKEKRLGPEDPAMADAYSHLGEVLQARGDYKSARASHERALAIREKALGAEDPGVAESLYHIGVSAYFLDDDEKSRAALERSVAVLEKTLGPDSPEAGRSLGFLGAQFMHSGNLAEARPATERSLQIVERALGPGHPLLAFPLTTRARTLAAAGELEAAEQMYRRAIDVVERALGPEHPDLIYPLRFNAYLPFEAGDFQTAAALRERRAQIAERSMGPWSPQLAYPLQEYAIALWHSGDRLTSRHLLERAVEIMTKVRDEDPSGYAFVVQDLGLFLLYIGDYDAALPHLQTVVEIAEKSLEPEHFERVRALANLAFLYVRMGRLRDALPLAEKSVEIWSRKLAPDDRDLARVVNTLAQVVGEMGDLGRARALHERALSIWEWHPAPLTPEMALDLEGLGKISLREGKPEAARGFFERAVDLRQATQGAEHPDMAVSLEGLARAVWLLGEPQRALELALRSEAIGRSHLQAAARGLSEREALRYSSIRPSGLDLALSILASSRPADVPVDAANRSWDQAIRSRAMILDEMGERQRALALGGTGGVAAQLSDLDRARQRFAQLLVMGAGSAGIEKYRGQARATRAEMERAERMLAEKSAVFRDSLARSTAGLQEVLRALPGDSTLVAYVRYGRIKSSAPGAADSGHKTPSYLAFVARAGADPPRIVPIGAAGEIDALVRKWRERVADRGTEGAYREAGEALKRAIWDPLEPHLKGAAQVFVVPDGTLSLVNLGALPVGRDRYLVESGPRLHFLSAERDLVRPARRGDGSRTLLALGGPDYEAVVRPLGSRDGSRSASGAGGRSSAAGSPSSVTEAASSATVLGRAAMYRGAEADCEALRKRRFEPLPGAWLEAQEVEGSWRASGRGGAVPPRLLTGAAADEGSFKRLAPEFSVIHLATHGFFAEGCNVGSESGETTGPRTSVDNPLLLSGLALAGANRRGEMKLEGAGGIGEAGGAGEAGAIGGAGEDGMLTAEEITSLDLSRAEWVVLSACETGLGKLEAGEGVLGLRRAFQIAGAGTLIMSLWPVEDAATRAWMKHLYEERLQGASTSEAVRNASLKVIEERRKSGKSVHPSTWGAFVAAGDWR